MTWNAEEEHLREVKNFRKAARRGGSRGGHLFILRRWCAMRGPGQFVRGLAPVMVIGRAGQVTSGHDPTNRVEHKEDQ
jgi:hypothetical protein